MNKTAILLAAALVASAFVIAAPTAAADTIVDCALWEQHEPAHCAADCTPFRDPANNPLHCDHEE